EHGGARDAGTTVVGPVRPRPHIALAADRPGRIAGQRIPRGTVLARLAELGCEGEGEYILAVGPPSWRPDLGGPAELGGGGLRLGGVEHGGRWAAGGTRRAGAHHAAAAAPDGRPGAGRGRVRGGAQLSVRLPAAGR